jgi:hypothetical protein
MTKPKKEKKKSDRQQYSGYVCEARLVMPTSSSYGLHGYLQIRLTSSPNCRGDVTPSLSLFHLTKGATSQVESDAFLLTENQLMTLLLAYSNAAASGTRVRINTMGLQILDVAFLSK